MAVAGEEVSGSVLLMHIRGGGGGSGAFVVCVLGLFGVGGGGGGVPKEGVGLRLHKVRVN